MENKNNVFSPNSFWGGFWWILTALMNAISLINIGRDLKITIVRWAEFLLYSFQFVEKIRDIILYPFIYLASMSAIEISTTTKNISFIVLLMSNIYMKGFISASIEEKPSYDLLYGLIVTRYIFVLGTFLFFIISGITLNIFFGNKLDWILIGLFLFLIAYMTLLITDSSGADINNSRKRKSVFSNLIITLIFAFLIFLFNYYYITFYE